MNGKGTTPTDLGRLRNLLLKHFSDDELNSLLFITELQDDHIHRSTKAALVESMIKQLNHQNRLDVLLDAMSHERPEMDWHNLSRKAEDRKAVSGNETPPLIKNPKTYFAILTISLFALTQFVWEPFQKKFYYNLSIIQDGSSTPIDDAIITIETEHGVVYQGVTEQDGVAIIQIPTKYVGRPAIVYVESEGHEIYRDVIPIYKVKTTLKLTPIFKPLIPDELEIIRDETLPLDILLVIDDSCSMYPKDHSSCAGFTQHGSDPQGLRHEGASVLFSRLGINQPGSTDYRAGIISFGDNVQIISHLVPLEQNRSSLSQLAYKGSPGRQTQLVPALVDAYIELRSAEKRPLNRKAIVLLTDGFPWPIEGQSKDRIEHLIQDNPNISHFIVLLNPPSGISSEFNQYVKFWADLSFAHSNVKVYYLEDSTRIEDIYHDISTRLEQTVASTPQRIQIAPNESSDIYISKYVNVVTFSVFHRQEATETSAIQIIDPKGQPINYTDPGVQWVPRTSGGVEVISIATPRLEESLKEKSWTIMSETPIEVITDGQGDYEVIILEPIKAFTEYSNEFLAVERYDRINPLTIKFLLRDREDKPIKDAQPLLIQLINSRGQRTNLKIPSTLQPDSQGIYTVEVNLDDSSLDLPYSPSRVTLEITGLSHLSPRQSIPVATARLNVDIHSRAISFFGHTTQRLSEIQLEASSFLQNFTDKYFCVLFPFAIASIGFGIIWLTAFAIARYIRTIGANMAQDKLGESEIVDESKDSNEEKA